MSLLLAGCSSGKPEKERFIDATVEVTCMVFQSGNILDPGLEQKTKDIFDKHGFDIDDEKGMEEIAAKYENDEDVKNAVTKAIEECGGDFAKLLESAGGAEVPADVEAPADAEKTE